MSDVAFIFTLCLGLALVVIGLRSAGVHLQYRASGN
jgi:hypothetical protein